MNQINVENLSAEELKKLVADAENALRQRHQKRIAELRSEAEELARELNTSVEELFGLSAKGKAGKSKLPPKFMNPENPEQTWTGRGKRPAWLNEALASGKRLEDMKILKED